MNKAMIILLTMATLSLTACAAGSGSSLDRLAEQSSEQPGEQSKVDAVKRTSPCAHLEICHANHHHHNPRHHHNGLHKGYSANLSQATEKQS